MRDFIDDNATFQIKIPTTWKYELFEGKVHRFLEYELWRPDNFQLSVKNLDSPEKLKNASTFLSTLNQKKINDKSFFYMVFPPKDNFGCVSWTTIEDKKLITFTFVFPIETDEDLENRTVDEKFTIIHEVISSFQLIKKEESLRELKWYRFDNFLQGIGATVQMLNNAIKNYAFIEATCLFASLIDAQLRIGIVLKKQILESNTEIELEWIYQGKSDKKKMEKDVYKRALELGVIDNDIFDELYKLYEDRNRVVHRFIISEITLAVVEDIAYKYSQLDKKIGKIIYDLESEQIKLNVGITKLGTKNGETETNGIDYLRGKIGKPNYFEKTLSFPPQ